MGDGGVMGGGAGMGGVWVVEVGVVWWWGWLWWCGGWCEWVGVGCGRRGGIVGGVAWRESMLIHRPAEGLGLRWDINVPSLRRPQGHFFAILY